MACTSATTSEIRRSVTCRTGSATPGVGSSRALGHRPRTLGVEPSEGNVTISFGDSGESQDLMVIRGGQRLCSHARMIAADDGCASVYVYVYSHVKAVVPPKQEACVKGRMRRVGIVLGAPHTLSVRPEDEWVSDGPETVCADSAWSIRRRGLRAREQGANERTSATAGCPITRPWWEVDPNLATCVVAGCIGNVEGFMFDAETENCAWCASEAWETPTDRRTRSGGRR